MPKCRKQLWAILGLFCLSQPFLCPQAHAERRIVPSFDSSSETILLSADVFPMSALVKGQWKRTSKGIVPPRKRGQILTFGDMLDGHFRFRFDQKRLRSRLLFRARFAEDGKTIQSAYSLRIDGNRAWIEEWAEVSSTNHQENQTVALRSSQDGRDCHGSSGDAGGHSGV